MRVRNRTNKATIVATSIVKDYKTGQIASTSYPVQIKDGYTFDYMSDTISHRFVRRRAKGEIIMNGLTQAKSKVSGFANNIGYSLINENRTGPTAPWVYLNGQTVQCSNWQSSDRYAFTSVAEMYATGQGEAVSSLFRLGDLAATADAVLLRARLNAASPDALVAVTLAEMNKTIDMFHAGSKMTYDLVNRLDHFPLPDVRELARLRIKDIKSIAKSVGRKTPGRLRELCAMWLGYRYGIMATYYDASSWLDAGKAVGTNRRARFMTTGSSSYRPADVTSVVTGSWSTNVETTSLARETKTSAGVLINTVLATEAYESFGALNVLSTAWELVPYSFVIDWFTDIGKRLMVFEGKSVSRPVIGSWVTHRSQLYRSKSFSASDLTTVSGNTRRIGLNMSTANCAVTETCELVQRLANPSVAVLPTFNVRLNISRVLDGVSLLAVASTKMKRFFR